MDLNNLLDGLKQLLNLMFGGQPPSLLLTVIAWLIAGGLVVAALVFILRMLKSLWKEFLEPALYNREDQRRRQRRQRFADHVESEIRRLNNLEDWSDHRFAELEAEVETEGSARWFSLIPSPFNRPDERRRERSLSHAIANSTERLILLEGEPGGGKSVALRHVAQTMASEARSSRSLQTVIPVFINLRDLNPAPGETIDRQLIEKFVLKTLNRVNDRDVESFLDEEFQNGLRDGTWLFLFDSFDEIPAILSSTDADETIRAYADAISDFLHGFNHCRGVVASREYRGPRRLGWPRFRIIQLTAKRREQLVHKTGLPTKTQDIILAGLSNASADFRAMAANPMFLGLVCEYMRSDPSKPFPEHTYPVFEVYMTIRFSRDADRVYRRFGKSIEEVRDVAENLAFVMTASGNFGLNPPLSQLIAAASNMGMGSEATLIPFVDALEFIKIARPFQEGPGHPRTFNFAHRRFQEYFATTVVLREPTRISSLELLTNARWRETAVVLLQTQSSVAKQPLLDCATTFLNQAAIEFAQNLGVSPVDQNDPIASLREAMPAFDSKDNSSPDALRQLIEWPPRLLHVLGILQDGFLGRWQQLPQTISKITSIILALAVVRGTRLDELWALQVVGAASRYHILLYLKLAITSPSGLIRDLASSQIARMGIADEELSRHIRNNLITLRLGIHRQRRDLEVQLARFEDSRPLLSALHCLLWASWIDFVLLIPVYILLSFIAEPFWAVGGAIIFCVVFLAALARWFSNPISRIAAILAGSMLGLLLVCAFSIVVLSLSESTSNLSRLLSTFLREPFTQTSALFLIALLYQSFWAEGAYSVVRAGKYTQVFYWPIFPFVAIFESLLKLSPLLRHEFWILILERVHKRSLHAQQQFLDAKKTLASLTPRDIGILTLAAVLAIGFVSLFVAALSGSLGGFSIPIVAIIGGFYVILIVFVLASSLDSFRRFHTWKQTTRNSLEFEDLGKILQSEWGTRYRLGILQHIRKKQLFHSTPHAELLLKHLITHVTNQVERPYASLKDLHAFVASTDPELAPLFPDGTESRRMQYEKSWNDNQLDELCRLLGQIQQSSQT